MGNSTFIGLNAGISAYGFDADLDYAHYGKKDKRFLNTIQYTGGLVLAGENLLGYTEAGYSGQLGAIGKHNVFYAKAKYTFAEKYWLGLDYVYDKAKGASADTFGGDDAEYKKGQ